MELSLMQKFADPALIQELSKAELVQGSLITTLMGMGTTFVVLTLLWAIIAAISKVINSTEKKGSTPSAAPAAAPVAAVPVTASAATVAAETGAELIAVITAAIAAMEGNASASNLIIRKINRISGNSTTWSRAGASEILDSRKI